MFGQGGKDFCLLNARHKHNLMLTSLAAADWDKKSGLAFSNTPAHLLPRIWLINYTV
jgi:hypothetical protein